MATAMRAHTAPSKTFIDGRGKTISTFVVFEIVRELRDLNVGDLVEVLTDESPPFVADIAAWCSATGHLLLLSEPTEEGHRFLVEKSDQVERDVSLAMVISSAGLSELLSPLGFALAGALSGVDVHLYFQGPAVRVLTRGYHPKLSGWARPFSRFAVAAMAEGGHIPPGEKLEQLRFLGAKFYVCSGSLEPFNVSPDDLIFDDMPIIEYLSFMPIMEAATVQMYV